MSAVVQQSTDIEGETIARDARKTDQQRRAKSLAWSDLSFHIKSKSKNDQGSSTSILDKTFGDIPASSLTCIVGPSGAGKTSLLNVLAGRVANGGAKVISGGIFVDGEAIDPFSYRKQIAYVMQDDAITPTSTPREALTFSANLRLGGEASKEEIDKMVENMLNDLGLSECADRMVGGQLIKGISGGERKRTSVGVELVTDPSLVFLDEPTSGLDAYTAHQLVQLLKRISKAGRSTVLCTMHQPSSEVFLSFDNAIVMKDGMIVYGGPVPEMTNFFNRGGFPIPDFTNPADHGKCTQGGTGSYPVPTTTTPRGCKFPFFLHFFPFAFLTPNQPQPPLLCQTSHVYYSNTRQRNSQAKEHVYESNQ